MNFKNSLRNEQEENEVKETQTRILLIRKMMILIVAASQKEKQNFAALSKKRSEDNESKKCQKLNCLEQRTPIKISFTLFGQERRQ